MFYILYHFIFGHLFCYNRKMDKKITYLAALLIIQIVHKPASKWQQQQLLLLGFVGNSLLPQPSALIFKCVLYLMMTTMLVVVVFVLVAVWKTMVVNYNEGDKRWLIIGDSVGVFKINKPTHQYSFKLFSDFITIDVKITLRIISIINKFIKNLKLWLYLNY